MAVYALDDRVPELGQGAYGHPDATVIGAVTLAAGVSVWPGAVVPFGFAVPARAMALGVPAKIRPGHEVAEGHVDLNVEMYFQNAQYYRDHLRRVD